MALTKNGTLQTIFLHDILYCEVFDHRVYIHTVCGDLEYSGTLDTLEGRVDERFFRCHRSFLVNMCHVVRQEKGFVFLTGGYKILVSRRKQKKFLQNLLGFLENEAVL